MKTTIQIADALFEDARRVAERERITFRAVVEEGLRLALERRDRRAASEPFRLRDASVCGEGLQPGVSPEVPRELAYDEGRGGP